MGNNKNMFVGKLASVIGLEKLLERWLAFQHLLRNAVHLLCAWLDGDLGVDERSDRLQLVI